MNLVGIVPNLSEFLFSCVIHQIELWATFSGSSRKEKCINAESKEQEKF